MDLDTRESDFVGFLQRRRILCYCKSRKFFREIYFREIS